jgi:putative oxidoreductase
MKSTLIHIGRTLLAIYFLLPGITKFTLWDIQMALMETHNMIMIPLLLATAGVIQIIGSICLILNKKVVECALVLAALVLLINFNLHDFWNIYEGVDSKHEFQNFYKNMGIFAGLLLLAAVNIEDNDS